MQSQLKNRYYLMRHGESLANRREIIVSHPSNALHEYGLTNLGAEQVLETALQTRLDKHTIVFSSDFKRARESAEIMCGVIDVELALEIDPLLRERDFGEWELKGQKHYETVWQNDLVHADKAPQGVESVIAVANRVAQLIQKLEQRYREQTLLLVGHGDVLQIALALHHNIEPRLHRSLRHMANAELRALAQLDLDKSSIA